MNTLFEKIKRSTMPILGAIGFLALFIIGIVLFSYVLIFAAIAGCILFCIAYLRAKTIERKLKKQFNQQSNQPSQPPSGRIIDYKDIE